MNIKIIENYTVDEESKTHAICGDLSGVILKRKGSQIAQVKIKLKNEEIQRIRQMFLLNKIKRELILSPDAAIDMYFASDEDTPDYGVFVANVKYRKSTDAIIDDTQAIAKVLYNVLYIGTDTTSETKMETQDLDMDIPKLLDDVENKLGIKIARQKSYTTIELVGVLNEISLAIQNVKDIRKTLNEI